MLQFQKGLKVADKFSH